MAQHDGGVRHPSQQLMDLATELTAVTTGHIAKYRRTWEDELGDTPEARAAAEAWRKWDIETPAVLLRAEWFGGQVARFYDWINPPDPRMRELFGLTYLDIAREEWWKLEWHTHVEFLQKLLASGLSPAEAASVLRAAQKMSSGRPINTKALVRTARRYKEFGFPIHSKNIWILQNATTPELKKLHDSVIYSEDGRKRRKKNELASEKSRKRAIRKILKRNLWVEKLNASFHQLSESSETKDV
jgi:hypothetical protein